MGAIGLNPIRLDRIGLDPIRINAIKLGVPGASGTERPYIDPEVLASLKAVCICYGKSNDDPDRAIVKNLVDPDNPFVISNAAFKLNSGFGKYSADFESFDWAVNISQKQHNKATISLNGRLCNHAAIEVDEMKVNIIGNVTELIYWYIANPDDTTRSEIRLTSGINTLPKSYAKDDGQTYNIGFAYISGDSEITIEQIPSFEGAFVTDGIDDLITSTKTVQEMLGGSNEITVVSMIHQIDGNVNYTNGYTNYIRHGGGFIRNSVSGINGKGFNKTGIYGYTSTQLNSSNMGLRNVINNILGDKDDYSFERSSTYTLDDAKYSVQNFVNANNQPSNEGSSVAWYWTIIANKVLTTDQINQVIAYFNLDRTLNPDILCDVKKQGITNENHAEFGDKLIDFSGNGRDIQLNNIAWKGDSGIGKYEVDFLDSSIWNSSNSTITSSKIDCKNAISHIMLLYYSVGSKEYPDIPSFKVIKTGADIDYSYIDETGSPKSVKIVDGVNILPASHNTLYSGSGRFCGFGNPGMGNSVTITQIPSHAGGLCLDGINDFGKVTGMPIYKDYTVIADYIRTSAKENAQDSPILSKSQVVNNGAFVFNYLNINSALNSYSFGTNNGLESISDSERKIYYQSKYVNDGKSINSGTGIDYNSMWLGTYRDNVQIFFNGAIYSLMSFPYSMSEFLIERQLKKHKLGTLYPDMVEFRPVIKANNDYEIVYTAIIKPDNWQEISVGDYVTVGESVAIQIKLNNPLEVTNVSSNSLADISFYKEENSDNIYTIYGRVLDGKSPQKITMDIQVDSSLVQWNPIITSTAELTTAPTFAIRGTSTLLKPGDWIPKNSEIWVIVTMNNLVDELRQFSLNGTFIHIPSSSYNPDTGKYGFPFVIDNESPQNINITIDEYIRYEDIVQPYPVLLRFNDENGNEVSWGGKFRVGSTITRIGSIADPESNLLNGLYSVSGLSLNGKAVTSTISIVEKQMVFKTTATWLLDDNEPKCILSPRLLRIPNSSYKILGHIPDISGHGNHGVIHNSAYTGMSGANGYPYDYNNSSFWSDSGLAKVVSGELVEYFAVKNSTGFSNITSGVYKGEIKVTGVTKAISENKISRLRIFTNSTTDKEIIDITQDGNYNIDIKGVGDANRVFFYAIPNNPNESIVVRLTEPIYIEQVGEYEGAYCLDGVDDHITIPTVTGGGKQVLMKVDNNTINSMLYDQRSPGASPNSLYNDFAIYCTNSADNNQIAYQSRLVGNTYIDGILNTNITCEDLLGILHNITITCDIAAPNNGVVPNIGRGGVLKDLYSNMALYDFMLFDNISTEDKIKELNEYVGIEAKVEKMPYYWDAYGKTNLDADKATIQQRGIAVGDYDLTNTNFAYDKMSGFGGYTLGKFTNSWSLSNSNNSISIVARNPYDITLKKLGENSDWEFNNTELKIISNPVSVKFKSDKNIRFTCDYHYYTVGGNSEGAPLGITSKDLIANEDTIITISPISQENIDKYNIDINRGYYLIYFQLSPTLEVNEEVTIEMLPLYPNGLVYDGITDFSKNVNIPAFTDYTYIFKRELLNNATDSCSLCKGDTNTTNEQGFVADYISLNGNIRGYSFGGYSNVPSLNIDKIIYGTKKSVNGTSVDIGSNVDSVGIALAKWKNVYKKMVFYKLILYPKTIPLLQINFLKNLMERDEIIDLNNKIFIQE